MSVFRPRPEHRVELVGGPIRPVDVEEMKKEELRLSSAAFEHLEGSFGSALARVVSRNQW